MNRKAEMDVVVVVVVVVMTRRWRLERHVSRRECREVKFDPLSSRYEPRVERGKDVECEESKMRCEMGKGLKGWN